MYEAVCALSSAGEVAEPVTVAEHLERTNGWSGKWLKITTGMVVENFRGSGVESYARAIKTAARTREALRIAANLQEFAGADVADAIDSAIRELMAINATSHNWHCHVKAAIGEAIDLIDAAHAADGKPTGISTGIRDLDESLGGMHG